MKFERAAIELLQRTLASWENVQSREVPREDQPPYFEIQFDGKARTFELRLWGGDARVPPLRPEGRDPLIVWILPRGSPEMRQQLRDANESFVDLTGRVRLSSPGLLVDRDDLEPPRITGAKETRNPFSDQASRIPRLLFAKRSRSWSIQELAEEAGVSSGLASYVVSALSERELVNIEFAGREKRVTLSDPESLILQWTAEYTWRWNDTATFSAPIGDPARFLKRLPTALKAKTWALTLQAGASLVARHAEWSTVHAYVPGAPDDLRRVGIESGWEPDEKGNVVLMRPYYRKSFLFGSRKKDSIPIVSDLQLILDLWHYPVRGREQAEYLLELLRSSR